MKCENSKMECQGFPDHGHSFASYTSVFCNVILILTVTTCGGLTHLVGSCQILLTEQCCWQKVINISIQEVSFPVNILLII
jgi:hypothetical protein